MNTLLSPSDLNFLSELPPSVRTEIEAWRAALARVTKPVRKSCAAIAKQMGVSKETALRKYYAYKRAQGDLKALLNRAKCPAAVESSSLSPEFIDWIKARCEQNQRASKTAWTKFVRAWQMGEEIPGLDNSLPRHCLPPGCSYGRIMAKTKDAFARDTMRRGLGFAIGKSGPQIFRTRANLWTMSHVQIDDLWHDNFVVFGKQIVRVLELDALDVFSGHLVTFGTKPRFQRDDGTMDGLKEKFARLLVASLFYNHGYSPRGTTIIAEHGTAAVSDHVKKILHDYTGGKIQVRESGITGEEQAIAGWRGQGKGNFRFKASLESMRNLKHNMLADLPGQTGKDRDHRPEQTHGQLQDCANLIKAMVVIARDNPVRASQLKLNLLQYHSDFIPLLFDVYDQINRRTDHQLEGWHTAGNIITQYRTSPSSGQWLTDGEFSQLPATARDILLAAAAEDQSYIQTRKLSPHEVFSRDRASLVKIPPFVIADLLGPDYARPLKVEGAYFNKFSDAELSPEPLHYESVIETPTGERLQLKDDTYQVFVNPFNLDQIFIHSGRAARKTDPSTNNSQPSTAVGPLLGTARRVTRIDPGDEKQLNAQYGNRSRRLAELTAPLVKRHTAMIREENARAAHNIEVLGPTPEETAEARQLRNEAETLASVDVVADQLARAKKSPQEKTPAVEAHDWIS